MVQMKLFCVAYVYVSVTNNLCIFWKSSNGLQQQIKFFDQVSWYGFENIFLPSKKKGHYNVYWLQKVNPYQRKTFINIEKNIFKN